MSGPPSHPPPQGTQRLSLAPGSLRSNVYRRPLGGGTRDRQESALSSEQLQVLQMIYDKFRERGTWTTFGGIDRPLRMLGLKPDAIIESMPLISSAFPCRSATANRSS